MNKNLFVVKVGGSLYDLPDLADKLCGWLATLPAHSILLVPGGGCAADVIRALDRCHDLGEDQAHWLALRALSLNAHFLQCCIPQAEVLQSEPNLQRGGWFVVDPHAFAVRDDSHAEALPHIWQVTSDAIAARIAEVYLATELILLKSTPIAENPDWEHAAQLGLVDSWFPVVVKRGLAGTAVRAVDFRQLKVQAGTLV